MNNCLGSATHMRTIIRACLLIAAVAVVACKPSQPSADYLAVCEGAPLRTVERRNKAMEDGYEIDHRYDCTTKSSAKALAEQKVQWEAANTPEARAARQAEFDHGAAESKVRLEPQERAAAGGLPWEGLRPGMSADDVKRTVAGTRAEGDRLANGAQLRLRKQGVIVAGIAFDATYYFDRDEHLSSVVVEKAGETTIGLLNINANDANLADYEKLTSFFRTKYGAETSSTKKSKETGFPGLSASSDWSAEGGKVFVSISPLTATTSMLSLGYQLGTK